MFCARCVGQGEIRGNGMMFIDCTACNGTGDIKESKSCSKEPVKIDKKSKEYKTAIRDIMKLHPEISHEKAVKMFEETFDKV